MPVRTGHHSPHQPPARRLFAHQPPGCCWGQAFKVSHPSSVAGGARLVATDQGHQQATSRRGRVGGQRDQQRGAGAAAGRCCWSVSGRVGGGALVAVAGGCPCPLKTCENFGSYRAPFRRLLPCWSVLSFFRQLSQKGGMFAPPLARRGGRGGRGTRGHQGARRAGGHRPAPTSSGGRGGLVGGAGTAGTAAGGGLVGAGVSPPFLCVQFVRFAGPLSPCFCRAGRCLASPPLLLVPLAGERQESATSGRVLVAGRGGAGGGRWPA